MSAFMESLVHSDHSLAKTFDHTRNKKEQNMTFNFLNTTITYEYKDDNIEYNLLYKFSSEKKQEIQNMTFNFLTTTITYDNK